MKSYKVSVWKLSVNKTTRKPTYLVRWVVEGQTFGESYKTSALADRFRAKLLRAVEKGEPFDTVTGLPDSLRGGKAALSFFDLTVQYLDHRWAEASAKHRDSMTDALAGVIPTLVKPGRGRPSPEVLRRALRSYVLPPPRREGERPEEITAAVKWIEKTSLPVVELQEISRVHELIDVLGRKLDGSRRPRRRTGVGGRWSSTRWSTPLSWRRCSPTRSIEYAVSAASGRCKRGTAGSWLTRDRRGSC